jgi:hypothetical protein
VEVYRPRVTPEAPGNVRPPRGETYTNDRYANDRDGRSYEEPAQRPSRGSVTPYEAGRSGRTVPAQPGPYGGRTSEEEGYRESRSYPGETARPQRVPAERGTEYPRRSAREAGGYEPGPESGRSRGQTQPERPFRIEPQARPEPSSRSQRPAQPEPSFRGGRQTQPESSTRGGQQRSSRQPASGGESSDRGESGYTRPRRG